MTIMRLWMRMSNEDNMFLAAMYRKGAELDYNTSLRLATEQAMAEGKAKGMAEGRAEGIVLTIAQNVCKLMANTGMDLDTAMNTLEVPDDKREVCAKMLRQQGL